MFKFLRKYNKWILAVGGTLLLIVFLVPQALQGLAERAAVRGVDWATMGDEALTAVERNQAEAELSLLDDFGIANNLRQVIDLERPEHWYLLTLEAERAGLMSGPASVDPDAEQLAPIFNNRSRGDQDFIRRTLARESGVRRLIAMYQDAGDFSDRRLQRYAERLLLTADAEVLAIPARPDGVEIEITEADLEAQLEAYADVAPGEGDMGFGYRLPNRFKIEWLTVDRAAVSEAIEAGGELDEVSLRKHWRRRAGAGAVGIPPVESGAAVPDIVRTDLLEEKTNARMLEVSRYAMNQLRSRLRGRRPQAGYFELDDAWLEERLAFPVLAQELRERFGITLPAYASSGDDWLASEDVPALEGVGAASTAEFGAGSIPIGTVLISLNEFGGASTVPVQEGITLPPFIDIGGTLYLVRVIDTDPTRPPRSVDEVRERLADDLRRRAHYDRLVERLSELEQTARDEGLLALALRDDIPLQRSSIYLNNPQILQILLSNPGFGLALSPASLPEIGVHEPTVGTIIDRCLSYPEGVEVAELPVEERVFALPVEDRLAVLLVGITGTQPLSSDLYDLLLQTRRIHEMVSSDEQDLLEDVRETFGFEAMAIRHDFALKLRPTEAAEEAEAEAEAGAEGETE